MLIKSCARHSSPADVVFDAARRFQTTVTIVTRLVQLVDLFRLRLLVMTRDVASGIEDFAILLGRERRRSCSLCLA